MVKGVAMKIGNCGELCSSDSTILIRLQQRISSWGRGNALVLPPLVTVRGFQLSLNHSSKWLRLVVGESLKAVLIVAVAVSHEAVT